jgi:alpha-N-arabinofuranosidase
LLAAVNLNIFARHADRVRMTNIAQMVNVIQSMIITDGAKMVLTPTYHVYRMYVPFQDATLIPLQVDGGTYRFDKITLPRVDAIAARAKDGSVWIAAINLDPMAAADFSVRLSGLAFARAEGEVLTGARVDAINQFSAPAEVRPAPFAAQASGGALPLQLAPKSLTVVRLLP